MWQKVKTWWHEQADFVDPVYAASTALNEHNYDEVIAVLLPYLVSHPHDLEAYMILGRAALDKEAWHEALAVFSEIAQRNPQQPWVWALYGYAALQLGQISLALPALQRARAESPDNQVILECLRTIAQRIDSSALRDSVERDLLKVNPIISLS